MLWTFFFWVSHESRCLVTFSHLQTLGRGHCFHCILKQRRLEFSVFSGILVFFFHLSQISPFHCFVFASRCQRPPQHTPGSSECPREPLCTFPSPESIAVTSSLVPEAHVSSLSWCLLWLGCKMTPQAHVFEHMAPVGSTVLEGCGIFGTCALTSRSESLRSGLKGCNCF